MKKTPAKARDNSSDESKPPRVGARVDFLTDRHRSSPRASLAFSALAAFDWIWKKFGSLRRGVSPAAEDARRVESQVKSPKRATQVCAFLLLAFSGLGLRAQQTALPMTGVVPVPRLVSFSGKLTDAQGRPTSQIEGVTFAIYKDQDGGAPLWLEIQNVKPDSEGNYGVQLGATKSAGLPLDLFSSGEARWLGVQVSGQAEQPRVFLLSVPYALKAADAETIGGLPPSAFVLATSANAASGTAPASSRALPSNSPPTISGTGTADYLPLWTDSSGTLGNSVLFQSGTGSTAKIGINTTTPSATLDVKGGATVRGPFTLASTGIATTSKGMNSYAENFTANTYNSSTKTGIPQNFRWQAEPVGNDTANVSGSLNLLFNQGSQTATETGLKIASNGQITFASGQAFPGTGTITGVTAGTGLAGGGTSGTVGLSVDPSLVPFLTTANTFSSTQAVSSATEIGFLGESNSGWGVYGSSSSNYGVVGASGTGIGTYGGSTSGDGVFGRSSSSNAVEGISDTGTGLRGESSSLYGVYGSSTSSYGVAGVTTSGNGVYGQVTAANQSGVVGRTLDSSGNWGLFAFGNIGASGTKSSVVPVDNGSRQVALYAVESPGVWFEDYGAGKLVSGVVTVNIDPAYAQTVNTGVAYHVFLTPDGDCEGLYVTARTATSFEVRELHHGNSNVAFDYRIIALRRGYETKRLADVTNATPRSPIETPRP